MKSSYKHNKPAVTWKKQNVRLLLLFVGLLHNQHIENKFCFTLKSISARFLVLLWFFGSTNV